MVSHYSNHFQCRRCGATWEQGPMDGEGKTHLASPICVACGIFRALFGKKPDPEPLSDRPPRGVDKWNCSICHSTVDVDKDPTSPGLFCAFCRSEFCWIGKAKQKWWRTVAFLFLKHVLMTRQEYANAETSGRRREGWHNVAFTLQKWRESMFWVLMALWPTVWGYIALMREYPLFGVLTACILLWGCISVSHYAWIKNHDTPEKRK